MNLPLSEIGPFGFKPQSNLLVDSNLLVLYIVGSVRREQIQSFKRTQKYTEDTFKLLLRILEEAKHLYTVAHVLAEVSNLTDLNGRERAMARQVLKETLVLLKEAEVSSSQAAEEDCYEALGLTDGAIASAAKRNTCVVLTDDLDLYVQLIRERVEVINFSHLRKAFGL